MYRLIRTYFPCYFAHCHHQDITPFHQNLNNIHVNCKFYFSVFLSFSFSEFGENSVFVKCAQSNLHHTFTIIILKNATAVQHV